MNTKVWEITSEDVNAPLTEETIEKLDEIKLAFEYGEIIAIPTETVYGLGANAKDPEAIIKIFQAKNRPGDNPLIVHVHSYEQVESFTSYIDDKVKKLMDTFWPGPISFILPLKDGVIASNTVAEMDSVAVRMPSHPVARKILEYTNIPIAAPSANLSGKPSPTDAEHVIHDLNGRIFGVVVSEKSEIGLESTVLDCTQFPYKVARPGHISIEELQDVLKEEILEHKDTMERPISPGMKYKHYAPRQPMSVVEGGINSNTRLCVPEGIKKNKVGVIAPETVRQYIDKDMQFTSLCRDEGSYREAAKNLYAALRHMDASDVEIIYIYGFKQNSETEALMNRIYKATGSTIIKG
ncbi:L-threonylcarbamoyladenylate synthase [Nosocomiicoccus sp. HMSC09A07]|uniref:L-threonylcarbamoyladenylate synthase n=1 Tax=Nosocomiicoccus sp. HMSC09A07 TaxID=1581145 RepID=UPI0008A4ABA5|nr:L-threonylcarbamoyladenylate synthase [Nosocomiicoccus sp. HMSC09A07]OFS63519.1 threonylcarbamoyl-AMP synthase [Nosocomiicoccus sp. HMSC09A07]